MEVITKVFLPLLFCGCSNIMPESHHHTRNKRPWKLIYVEIFSQKKEALIREKALKKYSHKQLQQLFTSTKNQLHNYIHNK